MLNVFWGETMRENKIDINYVYSQNISFLQNMAALNMALSAYV